MSDKIHAHNGPEKNAPTWLLSDYEFRHEYLMRVENCDGTCIDKVYAVSVEEAVERTEINWYLDYEPYASVEVIAQSWRPLFMFEAYIKMGAIIRQFNSRPEKTDTVWCLATDVADAAERIDATFGRNREITIYELYPDPLFQLNNNLPE